MTQGDSRPSRAKKNKKKNDAVDPAIPPEDRTIVHEPASTGTGGDDGEGPDAPRVVEIDIPAPDGDEPDPPGAGEDATIVSRPADLTDEGEDDGAGGDATIPQAPARTGDDAGDGDDGDPPSTVVGHESGPSGQQPIRMRDDLIGRTIGNRFRIEKRLGKGGMGSVFLGRDTSLDRDVAIKVISRQFAKSKSFVERFESEARIMAKLDHKHVVRVIEHGKAFGLNYIVMDLVREKSGHPTTVADVLSEHRSRKKKLPLAQALAWFDQACDAIHEAHEANIIHRDIKPGNMLVDAKGDIRIADFGIASDQASDVRHTSAQSGMGTGAYMAPEQARNPRDVDRRADVFSLGTVLYELLTGRVPQGSYVVPSKVRGDVPKALDAVIEKARQLEPSDRYKTAEALAAAARKAAGATLGQKLKVYGFYAAIMAVAISAAVILTRPSLEERWWDAVKAGQLDVAEELLAEDRSLLDYANVEDGSRTALIEAAERGDTHFVQALLEWGADPSDQDVNDDGTPDRTALMEAAERGHERVVALLVDGGANPAITDATGRTAVEIAMAAGQREAAVAIQLEPLVRAARNNDRATIDEILDQNPQLVKYRFDDGGVTLLHLAAYKGYIEAVRALLVRGAPVDSKTSHRIDDVDLRGEVVTLQKDATPLLAAVIEGHLEVIELLIEKGANVDWAGEENKRPLWYAVEANSNEIARRLLDAGEPADRLITDESGRPLFIFAIERGASIALIRTLATHDGTAATVIPDVRDARNVDGRSALEVAIARERCDVVEFLREAGAETTDEMLAAARASEKPCMQDLARELQQYRAERSMREIVDLIQTGAVEDLRSRLDDDPDLAGRTYRKRHLVQWALLEAPEHAMADIVQVLLEHEAPLGTEITLGEDGDAPVVEARTVTTLELTVETGNLEVFRAITGRLHVMAETERPSVVGRIKKRTADRETLLFVAVREAPELVGPVMELFEQYDLPGLVKEFNRDGETVLSVAVEMHLRSLEDLDDDASRIGAIRTILDSASPAQRDALLRTPASAPPLHQAVQSMYGEEMAKLLLEHGANLATEDTNEKVAIEVADFSMRPWLAQEAIERMLEAAAPDAAPAAGEAASESDDGSSAPIGGGIELVLRSLDVASLKIESWGGAYLKTAYVEKQRALAEALLEAGAPVGPSLVRRVAGKDTEFLRLITEEGTRRVDDAVFTEPHPRTGNTVVHEAATDDVRLGLILDWAANRNVDVCDLLKVKNQAGDTPAFVAAEQRNWSALERVLNDGYGSNGRHCDRFVDKDGNGRTLEERLAGSTLVQHLRAWRESHEKWFPPVRGSDWLDVVRGRSFLFICDRAAHEGVMHFEQDVDSITVRMKCHGIEVPRYHTSFHVTNTADDDRTDVLTITDLPFRSSDGIPHAGPVSGKLRKLDDTRGARSWVWETGSSRMGTITFTESD